jgi:hypothetical protein
MEAGLRIQETELVVKEMQLAEQQMQELAAAQKRIEDLQASHASEAQRVWNFLSLTDAALVPFGFNPLRTGPSAQEVGAVLPLLDMTGSKMSQLEEAVGSRLEVEGHVLAQAVAEHVMMCF